MLRYRDALTAGEIVRILRRQHPTLLRHLVGDVSGDRGQATALGKQLRRAVDTTAEDSGGRWVLRHVKRAKGKNFYQVVKDT